VSQRLAAVNTALQRTDLSDAARAKYEDAFAKLIRIKTLLERDDGGEDRFVRGPKWARYKERMRVILEDIPEALERAEAAFAEVEG
jgi:hypothetical protein